MAFEVFDDVAFYFLAMSVIASITIPWTAIKIFNILINICRGNSQEDDKDPINKILKKTTTKKKPWLTWSHGLLGFLWILLILLIIQLPTMQSSDLKTFNPYEVLGLEPSATPREIQKAYRSLALKFHPDKNKDNEAAAAKFLEVQKANEILSDAVKKADWDAGFLNPQKSAATSVTIGLPTILTMKENEMRILVVYFVLFMVLPPVFVFLWWKNAKNHNEAGVHNRTLQGFVQLINPNMGPKYLIEVLAFSAEFEPLQQELTNEHLKAYKSLYESVKENMMKEKFFDPKDPTSRKFAGRFDYVHRANVLIHAYLLRIDIPPVLKPHLTLITECAHRLLNVMLEVAIARQFIKPALGIIDLMQLITQSLWPHDSSLLQLAGLDESNIKHAKNIKSIAQFRRLTAEKKSKLFPSLTPKQLEDISEASEFFPEVSLSHKVSVEDEIDTEIFENDLITITATVQRLQFDPDRVEQAGRERVQDDSDESSESDKSDSSNKDPNQPAKIPVSPSNSNDSSNDRDSALVAEVKTIPSNDLPEEVDVDNIALDELAPVSSKKVEKIHEAPFAYAPRFPHDKREKWVVFLIEKTNKKAPPRLIAIKKVPALSRVGPNSSQEVALTFQGPPTKGVYDFELHAVCDSYIGCDKMESFKIAVHKVAANKNDQANTDQGDKKKEKIKRWYEDDENYEGKWYYFGLASFWELLLNIFVLGLLCVFLFNFMWSRGYWQRFVQPSVDAVSTFLNPAWVLIEPYAGPVITPCVALWGATLDWISKVLTVEPPKPKKQKEFASSDLPDHIKIETEESEETQSESEATESTEAETVA